MRTLRKYSLEILYILLALVAVYAIPLVLRVTGSDDYLDASPVGYYTLLVPVFTLVSVVWYTVARRGRYIFAVASITVILLGQGLLIYRKPEFSYDMDLGFCLVVGVFVALMEGGAAAVTALFTAFINACRKWNDERKKRLKKENPMNEIQRITSFSIDHDKLTPGIYISRVDGDVTTYDLRTRTPNGGDYMDTRTAHSVEHMFATYVRNSAIADSVLYFGPMGCRTGFYLLVRDEAKETVLAVVKDVLQKILAYEGEVFGASRIECGNYLDLDLADAKRECAAYLDTLNEKEEWSFSYE